MKAALLVILAIVIVAFLRWSGGEYSLPLPMILPLLAGLEPSIYDAGGAVALFITLISVTHLRRRHRD
jgi:hypothetical protein